MSKIPTRKVNSDSCVIHVGRVIENEKVVDEGKSYNVHKGEWVKVIPLLSVRQWIAWNKIMSNISEPEKLEEALDAICQGFSEKVTDWNWTDNEGNPLPKPYHNPDVFKELTEEELVWLSTALVETEVQRKNA